MNKFYQSVIKLRSRLLVFLTHNMALPVLRIIRQPKPFPYTKEELQSFPDHTLGKELIVFLEKKELQLLPYYAKHDIKHILLQYDTTDEGEVCLQCFMLGNRHLSFPVVATVLYGFVTMPEYWRKFKQAYRRGRKANSIANWQWFEILKETTQSLMYKIESKEKPLSQSI